MINYTRMVLSEAPKELIKKATTPVAHHLFKTNQHNPIKLNDERVQAFHWIVMQLQYLAQMTASQFLPASKTEFSTQGSV